MAVNDIVSARIAQASPSTIQVQPPHFGRVTAEAAGPPIVETVLWDTAEVATVTAASAANLFLDVIEDADQPTRDKFIGQNVLRIAPGGALPNAPAGGTSFEFTGVVVAVYRRRPFEGAPGSGSVYLLMKSGELFFEDVATQFAVVTP